MQPSAAVEDRDLPLGEPPRPRQERAERGSGAAPHLGDKRRLGPRGANHRLGGGRHRRLGRSVLDHREAGAHRIVADPRGRSHQVELRRALHDPQLGGEVRGVAEHRRREPLLQGAGTWAPGRPGTRRSQSSCRAARIRDDVGERSAHVPGVAHVIRERLGLRALEIPDRVGQKRRRAGCGNEQRRLLLLDAVPARQVSEIGRVVVAMRAVQNDGVPARAGRARSGRGDAAAYSESVMGFVIISRHPPCVRGSGRPVRPPGRGRRSARARHAAGRWAGRGSGRPTPRSLRHPIPAGRRPVGRQ